MAKRLDEGRLCERNQISRTVKKILKDKIEQGKVTEKWIEECLPREYKRQYAKSEPSSLSKQQQQIIEVSTEGKQVSPEQQNDDKGIDGLTEIQPSNNMNSADILNQQPPAAELEAVEDEKEPTIGQPSIEMGSVNKLKQQTNAADSELEAVEDEKDNTATADSVLTTDDEYASLMPVTSDSDLEVLKISIQERGQCVPIVVNQDRVIIDGHLRHRACQELGIEPTIIVSQFENRLQQKEFIIESNLNRRHLNEFQRIELQIKLESIKSEIAKERMSDPGMIGVEK